MLVSEEIRFVRKQHGYTQEALAKKAGISVQMLNFVETGRRKPSLAMLDKIAKALYCTVHIKLVPRSKVVREINEVMGEL